ncbi:MAG TPA: GLPGLI family protein [Mucilaginibacter sp.]|nr:GLPGLI family protein [Mucilaginibacter sp.]
MKKIVISFICLLVLSTRLMAQHAHFTTSGAIEFERKTNMFAIIPKLFNKDNEAWYTPLFDAYKKSQPQFKTSKSTLSFASGKTLFTPAEEEMVTGGGYFANSPFATQNNTIYTDLETKTGIFQKKVFDELFLVKDSTRKIKWKITDETREIAGYNCRRANAIMMDSIYVVAFYTTDIPISGGPESFNGLPGMILGVALPHENIAWFATKVTDMTLAPTALAPPKKGKSMDGKAFRDKMLATFKDWGSEAPFYSKIFSL